MQSHVSLQLFRSDHADLEQDLAEAARVPLLLSSSGATEIGLGDLSRPDEHVAQPMRIAADRREHDRAAVEEDGALIVAQRRYDAQRARLAAQIEQLEDVVDSKLAQRSFDRHR